MRKRRGSCGYFVLVERNKNILYLPSRGKVKVSFLPYLLPFFQIVFLLKKYQSVPQFFPFARFRVWGEWTLKASLFSSIAIAIAVTKAMSLK